MTRRSTSLAVLATAALIAAGCNEDAPTPDAGPDPIADASTPMDAAPPADGGPPATDAGDGCVTATVSDWRLADMDDVSIRYRARISPDVEEKPFDLYLWFNRYATEYVGTFPLGEGDDANFGSCARCVMALHGPSLDDAFFATAGTFTSRTDPFDQQLDLTLTGVRLVEVTIAADATGAIISTPVEGGACIEIAEASVDATFPSPGWTCPAEQFRDGTTCHCGCGAFDPDCGEVCPFPPDPSCDPTPRPVVGCGTDELCTWEGACVETCDYWGREGCTRGGVCTFDAEGDRCRVPSTERIDTAALGESCTAGNWLCGIDDAGFAMGVCDDFDGWRCKPACDGDEDCPVTGESCYLLYDDGIRRHGYCRPPPPTEDPSEG